jgi:hypothetical protein
LLFAVASFADVETAFAAGFVAVVDFLLAI